MNDYIKLNEDRWNNVKMTILSIYREKAKSQVWLDMKRSNLTNLSAISPTATSK